MLLHKNLIRLAQENLASKNDIANFLKYTDFNNNKLKKFK